VGGKGVQPRMVIDGKFSTIGKVITCKGIVVQNAIYHLCDHNKYWISQSWVFDMLQKLIPFFWVMGSSCSGMGS